MSYEDYIVSQIGLGRTTLIGFHPSIATTFYVGAAIGGIWRTTDGGQSYTPLGDDLPHMAVNSIIVRQDASHILYIKTLSFIEALMVVTLSALSRILATVVITCIWQQHHPTRPRSTQDTRTCLHKSVDSGASFSANTEILATAELMKSFSVPKPSAQCMNFLLRPPQMFLA